MKDFSEIEKLVADHIDKVAVTSYAIQEARERAAQFLVIQAHLANHLKALDDVKVKASTNEKAHYAQALMKQDGKNVTANKINAEADPEYAAARETIELIDAEHNWTKRHFDIFGNAHVMFRQISMQNGV